MITLDKELKVAMYVYAYVIGKTNHRNHNSNEMIIEIRKYENISFIAII